MLKLKKAFRRTKNRGTIGLTSPLHASQPSAPSGTSPSRADSVASAACSTCSLDHLSRSDSNRSTTSSSSTLASHVGSSLPSLLGDGLKVHDRTLEGGVSYSITRLRTIKENDSAAAQPAADKTFPLAPLPSDLATLSRPQLESITRALHDEVRSTRLLLEQARLQESKHKEKLDSLAQRAFQAISKLRGQASRSEKELAETKKQLQVITDKHDRLLANLASVVPLALGARAADGHVPSRV